MIRISRDTDITRKHMLLLVKKLPYTNFKEQIGRWNDLYGIDALKAPAYCPRPTKYSLRLSAFVLYAPKI